MPTSRRDRLLVVVSLVREERLGAAKLLAADADRHLLVVDLARVTARWIGETEKNLAAVFDQAARHRSVLFFDEADALFGRRAGVRTASDRYANLEVSHLVTHLEDHPAIPRVVLGTARVPSKPPSGARVLDLSCEPRRL